MDCCEVCHSLLTYLMMLCQLHRLYNTEWLNDCMVIVAAVVEFMVVSLHFTGRNQ